MKILYAAGPRIGAGEQMRRIIKNFSSHEFKTAGYSCNTKFYPILNWNLDYFHSFWHEMPALKSIYEKNKLTPELEDLAQEIGEYNPDLILCDGNFLIASLGHLLKIPLWYCSPIHLIDGVNLRKKDYFYRFQLDQWRMRISYWPKADKYLIYSPFGAFDFFIKKGYEFVTPYYNEIDECLLNENFNSIIIGQRENNLINLINKSEYSGLIFNKNIYLSQKNTFENFDEIKNCLHLLQSCLFTGETSFLTDLLQTRANLFITPSLSDPETIINASISKILGVAEEFGQIDVNEKYAISKINDFFFSKKEKRSFVKLKQKFLHEILK